MAFYTVRELWAAVSQAANTAGVTGYATPFIKGAEARITHGGTIDAGPLGDLVDPTTIRATVNFTYHTVAEVLSGVDTLLNTNPPGLGDLETLIPKGVLMAVGDIQITQFSELPAVRLKGDNTDSTAIAATVGVDLRGDAMLPLVAQVEGGTTSVGLNATVIGSPTPVGVTVANPAGQKLSVGADIGNTANAPFGLAVSGPNGGSIAAAVTIGGTAPLKIDLGSLGFQPGLKITFHLFGLSFLPLLSIRLRGNATFGS
jgi:phage tail protein X